jgi:hypothetical protein
MSALPIVVGLFTDIMTGRLASFVILIPIVALLTAAFLVVKRREYVMTSQRACAATGLTEKSVVECSLEAVRDVRVEQPGWQQLINVGTLTFSSDEN